MNVNGKTIVLTGANGGIGSALAQQLAGAGATLVLVGRDEAALEQVRLTLASPQRHPVLVCDLQHHSGLQRLLDFCKALPSGVDVLINNAGMSDFAFVSASDPDVTRALIDLNLTVPMTLTSALLPHLLTKPEALVVNIGSVFGSIGYPGFAVYGASKAGLKVFSEALRRELADSTVRVLYVAPRATQTPMNSKRVIAMNEALGNTMDPPIKVATAILSRIQSGRWSALTIGWPERLFVVLNSLLPRITDSALLRQLPRIRQYSRLPTNVSSKKVTDSNLIERKIS
ncbi:MAG: SDR family oxidoreductase [Pseudohongiella sp.]|nr:SDR family oxidoreductase [Pseudohongiella sp.]